MAGSLSDFAELELLDHVLKVGEYTPPTHIYVALSTADPGESGAGISEPGVGGYARVQHDSWDAATGRATENTGTVTFPEATANWGTITHFALFDDPNAGNMLAYGELVASKTINTGDNASFADGAINASFSAGGISDYLANKLLDHLFKVGAYDVPANIYVALCTAAISDSDTGTTITEPASNYARKQFNTWNTAAAGATSNNGAITFVQATDSWGTITHFCLVDASTAGNLLLYAEAETPKAVGNGDTVEFADTALAITLT